MPAEDGRGRVLCSWQAAEDLCDDPLTPASPSHPHFSFLRTPRSVQFENGNPLFYLKLGSLALLHRKGDSLQTAVGAKFDYSAARTKAWVSAEDPLGMPDQRPAAL